MNIAQAPREGINDHRMIRFTVPAMAWTNGARCGKVRFGKAWLGMAR